MYAELKRICKICNEEKLINLFRFRVYKDNRKPRHEKRCKSCESKLNRVWSIKNPLLRKESEHRKFLKKYNISDSEYKNLLKIQDYKCAICGVIKSVSGRRLSLDHCHTTGKIRGLLCNECNTSLGLLKESSEIVKSMERYINKFKK